MSKIAVFVDAGYFWVQATHLIHGVKSPRSSIVVDYDVLRARLIAVCHQDFQCPLLRVYWYDGPSINGAKAKDHLAVDELDDFKLRLGTRNRAGDQKAVDGFIIADLISLAQQKAIAGALVVSGDGDLTPGVVAAQALGIRVHLLSIGSTVATSPYLRAEVDRKIHWTDADVRSFASSAGQPSTAHVCASTAAVPVTIQLPAQVVTATATAGPAVDATTQSSDWMDSVVEKVNAKHAGWKFSSNGSLPPNIDGYLLWFAGTNLGRPLDDAEKREIRARMRKIAKAKS